MKQIGFLPQQYPNNLTHTQYQELVQGSAIALSLIALNFFHLEGNEPYERLFISAKIPRLNTGRVSSGFLKRFRHVEQGGWWCSGLDPFDNWQPMEWGRFKPLSPRLDWESSKLIKYESPPKTPNTSTTRVAKTHILKDKYSMKLLNSQN